MEAAIHLISKIPGDTLKVICLVALTAVFFVPLLFVKKNNKPSFHEMLKEAKMVLEIKKLVIELEEKLNTYSGYSNSQIERQKDKEAQHYVAGSFHEQDYNELPYYKKIRCSMLGSGFFFMITTMAMLNVEHEMVGINEYVGVFARDLAVCIASGFAATFIPWGSYWYYFIYGFVIPILIATIIAIIT